MFEHHYIKQILSLVLILAWGICPLSPIFSESLAEKTNQKDRAPEENWLAKILGAATAVGVGATVYNKATETSAIKKVRPMTAAELKILDQFFEMRGGFDLGYGYEHNFLSNQDQISGPRLGLRARIPGNFAVSYSNQQQNYHDGSFVSLNRYALEWYLMPVISTDGTAQEIGAYIGGRATKVIPSETRHNDLTYGLLYTFYDLRHNLSFSLSGDAAVMDWVTYTVDYTGSASFRYHMGQAYLALGGTVDVTDLNNLRINAMGGVGIRF